jgi:hypothetical protein
MTNDQASMTNLGSWRDLVIEIWSLVILDHRRLP